MILCNASTELLRSVTMVVPAVSFSRCEILALEIIIDRFSLVCIADIISPHIEPSVCKHPRLSTAAGLFANEESLPGIVVLLLNTGVAGASHFAEELVHWTQAHDVHRIFVLGTFSDQLLTSSERELSQTCRIFGLPAPRGSTTIVNDTLDVQSLVKGGLTKLISKTESPPVAALYAYCSGFSRHVSQKLADALAVFLRPRDDK
jgi:hypothetical protein